MDILNSLTSIDSIVKYVESSSIDNIIQEVSKLHNISIDELCNLKIEGYSKENLPNSYYVVLMEVKENIYKYEWLYHKLSDINSKRSLLNLLRYRLTTDTIFIKYEIDKDIIYTYEDKKRKYLI